MSLVGGVCLECQPPGDIAIPRWSPSRLPRQAASQYPHPPKSEATQLAWVPHTDADDLQGSPETSSLEVEGGRESEPS